MELSFVKEGWTPNYVKLKQSNVAESFLTYVEGFIRPLKRNGVFFVRFDFGDKQLEIPCSQLEGILYELKQNECNHDSKLLIPYTELADFFGFFNLIEQTKHGYLMVDDAVKKMGDASLATLLGHILVEKHSPLNRG